MLRDLSLLNSIFYFCVFVSAFLRGREMAGESERERRRDKVRRRQYYLLLYVLPQADSEL